MGAGTLVVVKKNILLKMIWIIIKIINDIKNLLISLGSI